MDAATPGDTKEVKTEVVEDEDKPIESATAVDSQETPASPEIAATSSVSAEENVPEVKPTPDEADKVKVEVVENEGAPEPCTGGEEIIEESSVMEMEVDDSNTGDTVTSNPEIDLGSAAAAATAVIDEGGEKGSGKVEKGNIVIVSTQSIASSSPSSTAASSAPSSVVTPTPTSSVKDTPASPVDEEKGIDSLEEARRQKTPSPASVATPPAIITEESEGQVSSSSSELVAETRSLVLAEDIDEPMDTSESDGPPGINPTEPEEIAEPTDVVLESISATEMEHDLLDQMPDQVFEEGDVEQTFLHEEDSMTSLPDEGTELDKENNVVDRDLIIIGDEDDDETYLEITRRRISQDREGNCYCGKDRNFNIPELLCASCYRWFHESCISYQLGKLVPFTTNYVFTCKNCSPTGLEVFRRNQAQFSQMCETVLANLTQASAKEGTNMKIFSKDRDIIPFFEIHWEALTTTTRRVTQSWHSTVIKTLTKEAGVLYTLKEVPGDELSPYFGLMSDDLTQIRPNYDAMIKAGQLKITDSRNCSSSLRGRGAKRRTITDQPNGVQNALNKKPRDNYSSKPMIGHGYPTEHPYNKDSYRYILAEPDPNAPFRQEFDESNEWSGKPIHGWLCRIVNPPSVLLALHDRAPQLRVSDDRLSVTGDKGYCMIRATHGISRGSWYFEAKITEMPEGSATRIGFSQQFGNLQGPLGFDRYGYSWRSRYGTAFHEARGKSFAKGGFGLEDVLGFLIILPEDKNLPTVAPSMKDRPLVKVKSHLYYEDKDDVKELNKRDRRKGSKILCFKNGVCQGVAFEDIFSGTYYPAISVYKSITVKLNFGPDFEAPPTTELEFKAMSDRAEDSVMEQTVADLVYLTENDGKLHLDNAVPMPL